METAAEYNRSVALLQEKATDEFTSIAKEPVYARKIKSTLYGFGSELAVLRLFAKYNTNGTFPNSKVRVGECTDKSGWFFSIDN